MKKKDKEEIKDLIREVIKEEGLYEDVDVVIDYLKTLTEEIKESNKGKTQIPYPYHSKWPSRYTYGFDFNRPYVRPEHQPIKKEQPKEGEYYWTNNCKNTLYRLSDHKLKPIQIGKVNLFAFDDTQLTKATKEEIETELIKEAKRRGFKEGVKIVLIKGRVGEVSDTSIGDQLMYDYNNDEIIVHSHSCSFTVYLKGKWAEIIEEEKKYEFGKKEVAASGFGRLNASRVTGYDPHYITLGEKEIISCDNPQDRLSLNDLKIIHGLRYNIDVQVNGFEVNSFNGGSSDRDFNIGCVNGIKNSELYNIIELLEKQ